MRGEARDHGCRPGAGPERGSPHHAGQNIGLCNGKLSAMSGEEVESMEPSKLADHVGKVGPPGGSLGAWRGLCFQLPVHGLCPSTPLYSGVCLLQDQPEAQTQNHKGTL